MLVTDLWWCNTGLRPLPLSKNDWWTWVRVKCTVTPRLAEGVVREYFWIHEHGSNNRGRPPHYRGFTITLTHTTIGSTPLDEWSAHCWERNLIRHNIHHRHASMLLAGFKPTIPPNERPQTHALDCAARESRLTLNHLFRDLNSVFITFLKFLRL
jgi:hypothetical protein